MVSSLVLAVVFLFSNIGNFCYTITSCAVHADCKRLYCPPCIASLILYSRFSGAAFRPAGARRIVDDEQAQATMSRLVANVVHGLSFGMIYPHCKKLMLTRPNDV